jgi:flagellar protein FlbD
MIRLTRLRNAEALYLNPDQIERLDRHHETLVLMSNGTEYVVTEDAEMIIDLIVSYRARVIAAGQQLLVTDEQEPED